MIINMLVSIMFWIARMIAGAMLPRLIQLIFTAQSMFGDGAGPEKKQWVVTQLYSDTKFIGSMLITLPKVVVSALVDVIVAWTKTKKPSVIETLVENNNG